MRKRECFWPHFEIRFQDFHAGPGLPKLVAECEVSIKQVIVTMAPNRKAFGYQTGDLLGSQMWAYARDVVIEIDIQRVRKGSNPGGL